MTSNYIDIVEITKNFVLNMENTIEFIRKRNTIIIKYYRV